MPSGAVHPNIMSSRRLTISMCRPFFGRLHRLAVENGGRWIMAGARPCDFDAAAYDYLLGVGAIMREAMQGRISRREAARQRKLLGPPPQNRHALDDSEVDWRPARPE
jgi:hypothetical protein